MKRKVKRMPRPSEEADVLMYKSLRQESRNLLGRLGVSSNPGFTNSNIIESLRTASGLQKAEEVADEFETDSMADFALALKKTLEDIGVPVHSPFDELSVLEAIIVHRRATR